MQRSPVESSMIASVGHDPKTNTLEIEFKKGKVSVWSYQPITEEGFKQMMNSESIGKYFLANIKDNDSLTATKIS